MKQHLAQIAIIVKDYDEAIAFYTGKLGFVLRTDDQLNETKRWVIVAPPGANECGLLLARAADERQAAAIGNQSGGRVFLFLHTDDFWSDYERYKSRDIRFVREPSKEAYGTVAVFEDLYGNLWDLIERDSIE